MRACVPLTFFQICIRCCCCSSRITVIGGGVGCRLCIVKGRSLIGDQRSPKDPHTDRTERPQDPRYAPKTSEINLPYYDLLPRIPGTKKFKTEKNRRDIHPPRDTIITTTVYVFFRSRASKKRWWHREDEGTHTNNKKEEGKTITDDGKKRKWKAEYVETMYALYKESYIFCSTQQPLIVLSYSSLEVELFRE